MKIKKKNVMILLLLFTIIWMVVPANAEEDVKIKYGTSEITVKVLEDFSESEIDMDRVWRDGFVELKDGKILSEGANISDCYLITMPKAEPFKEQYLNAKYIGFEMKNASDGDIYYCFQCSIVDENTNKALLSPFNGDEIVLVDKNGFSHDIVFSDGPSVYTRYGFIIPEGFDGYVLIPTNRIIRFFDTAFDWETEEPVWGPDLNIEGIGIHVSVGLSSTPEVDASFVELYVDNFLIFNDEFPTYEAPPTPEPTVKPTPTVTPEKTSTPVKTNNVTASPKEDVMKDNDFPILLVGIAAAVVVVLVIAFIVIKQKKK